MAICVRCSTRLIGGNAASSLDDDGLACARPMVSMQERRKFGQFGDGLRAMRTGSWALTQEPDGV